MAFKGLFLGVGFSWSWEYRDVWNWSDYLVAWKLETIYRAL